MRPGEGICTDMRAVRKDYFLDHDHSAYVDQWDWERDHGRGADARTSSTRRAGDLEGDQGAEALALEMFPKLRDPRYPSLPDELEFLHAEEVLDMYPDLPRKQRETRSCRSTRRSSSSGSARSSKDGYPHEMRAADYDDWVTRRVSADGRPMHGLNGDILVWNPVTRRRHELTSMGIRVTKETLRRQLELTGQLDFLELPYHRAILDDEHPALDRRWHRPVAVDDAPAPQGPPGRGERDRVAEG